MKNKQKKQGEIKRNVQVLDVARIWELLGIDTGLKNCFVCYDFSDCTIDHILEKDETKIYVIFCPGSFTTTKTWPRSPISEK